MKSKGGDEQTQKQQHQQETQKQQHQQETQKKQHQQKGYEGERTQKQKVYEEYDPACVSDSDSDDDAASIISNASLLSLVGKSKKHSTIKLK